MKRASGWLLVIVGLMTHELTAQVRATKGGFTTATSTAGTCSGDKVQLTSFTVAPSNPAPGQSVTVKIDMENLCGASLNVPYTIANGQTVVSSGTKTLGGGAAASVQYSWTATEGNHWFDAYLDGNNALNESSSARANNYAANEIALKIEGWNSWVEKAKPATRDAIRSWFQQAAITGVQTALTNASGGVLAGPPMELVLKPAMVAKGVPDAAANALAGGFAQGWHRWAASLHVNGPNWYPQFTSAPGPVAPPTPNQPSKLGQMVQVKSSMSSSALAQAVKARLPAGASAEGATVAVDNFASWAAACFNALDQTEVKNVMASGPVPGFSLVTPSGPVWVGIGSGAPGHMSPTVCQ
ncbi:MAG: hypothetical protein ACT443_04105 [Gemmatimonadota bacterium]